jgi:hypothetical protein
MMPKNVEDLLVETGGIKITSNNNNHKQTTAE